MSPGIPEDLTEMQDTTKQIQEEILERYGPPGGKLPLRQLRSKNDTVKGKREREPSPGSVSEKGKRDPSLGPNPMKPRETSRQQKNSERFTDKSILPKVLHDSEILDSMPLDKVVTMIHEYELMNRKEKSKQSHKMSVEKSDDKITSIKIEEGVDDAKVILHKEARNLRPAILEIKDQMSWLEKSRKEIIRNLPLEVYGLQDQIQSKVIEACHDLTSTLKIDMFGKAHKRGQSATKSKINTLNGKVTIEAEDIFGEIYTSLDVLEAWTNLAAVWQKLHPIWPAAHIAIKTILHMKCFEHCNNQSDKWKAKNVSITFSNRLLQQNAQRAASNKGPVSFEKAKILAQTVCTEYMCPKEPSFNRAAGTGPATKPKQDMVRFRAPNQMLNQRRFQQPHPTGFQRPRQSLGKGKMGYVQQMLNNAVLHNNMKVCPMFNNNNCFSQQEDHCMRGNEKFLHVCAQKTQHGEVCGKPHPQGKH